MVGRRLPWPGGLGRENTQPAAPVRGPWNERPSLMHLDPTTGGGTLTSTLTGPPRPAGCSQQCTPGALVRLLPSPQAPGLALRHRPDPVSRLPPLCGIWSPQSSPGSRQHPLASFLWTQAALSCGWTWLYILRSHLLGKPLPTPPLPLHTLTHTAAIVWGHSFLTYLVNGEVSWDSVLCSVPSPGQLEASNATFVLRAP